MEEELESFHTVVVVAVVLIFLHPGIWSVVVVIRSVVGKPCGANMLVATSREYIVVDVALGSRGSLRDCIGVGIESN